MIQGCARLRGMSLDERFLRNKYEHDYSVLKLRLNLSKLKGNNVCPLIFYWFKCLKGTALSRHCSRNLTQHNTI